MGKKEERMDTGQVGFKDITFRRLMKNVPVDKAIVKRLEKSKREEKIDYKEGKTKRDDEERARRKKWIAEQKDAEKKKAREDAEKAELESYASLRHLAGQSNQEVSKTGTVEEAREIEDDFM